MAPRIPPSILSAIPLELKNLWTPPAHVKYSEVASALDMWMGAQYWRKLIATKYEVQRPELLATRPGMNRDRLSMLLRTEFPAPWVYTLASYKGHNLEPTTVYKWLQPACEIDSPLAQHLKQFKSRFCTNTIFTLPPVEPNRYPTIFTVRRRWFYAGRLEAHDQRRGKESAMSIFERALKEARQ